MSTPHSDLEGGEALRLLLNGSAPSTPGSDGVSDDDLRHLVHSVAPRRRPVGRRISPKLAAWATVALVSFGTVSAAAAVTLSPWHPMFDTPDAVAHIVLPSGTACEFRVIVRPGTGTDAERRAALDFLRSEDVMALADIDGERDRIIEREAGSDETRSEDRLFYDAATGAVLNAVWDRMESTGIIDPVAGSNLSLAAQSDCAGADW